AWGEQGATAPGAVNPGPVNGQPGSKGFFTCYCAGTAGNGLPGASATVAGGPGGAGGWGLAAPNLSLTIGEIRGTGGANVLTVAGNGGTGGTRGDRGHGGRGGAGGGGRRRPAPRRRRNGGNAGQDPAACQKASEWLSNSPCPVTVGGTGGSGTAAGNGGTGGTGGTGPTIVIFYTQANKPNLKSNMSVTANAGMGGAGGGGG